MHFFIKCIQNMRKAAPYPKPLPKGKGTYRRNTRIKFGSNGQRKAGNKKSHPNGWLFLLYIRNYSSLVQLVLSMRKYER